MSTSVISALKGYYCTITKDTSGSITDITNQTAMDLTKGFKFPKDPNKTENFNAIQIKNDSPVQIDGFTLDLSASQYNYSSCTNMSYPGCDSDDFGGTFFQRFELAPHTWPIGLLSIDFYRMDKDSKVSAVLLDIDPVAISISDKPLAIRFKNPLQPNESLLIDCSKANINITNTIYATCRLSLDIRCGTQCSCDPTGCSPEIDYPGNYCGSVGGVGIVPYQVVQPLSTYHFITFQSTDPSTYGGGDTPSGGGGDSGNTPKASIDINLRKVFLFFCILLFSLFMSFSVKFLLDRNNKSSLHA